MKNVNKNADKGVCFSGRLMTFSYFSECLQLY